MATVAEALTFVKTVTVAAAVLDARLADRDVPEMEVAAC